MNIDKEAFAKEVSAQQKERRAIEDEEAKKSHRSPAQQRSGKAGFKRHGGSGSGWVQSAHLVAL